VEPPPAREREDLLDDCATCVLHLRLHTLKIGGIEYNQRPSRGYRVFLEEPSREPAVFKAGIVQAIVGEFPTKKTGIKSLRFGDIRGWELDIVDPPFVR